MVNLGVTKNYTKSHVSAVGWAVNARGNLAGGSTAQGAAFRLFFCYPVPQGSEYCRTALVAVADGGA